MADGAQNNDFVVKIKLDVGDNEINDLKTKINNIKQQTIKIKFN